MDSNYKAGYAEFKTTNATNIAAANADIIITKLKSLSSLSILLNDKLQFHSSTNAGRKEYGGFVAIHLKYHLCF